MATITYFPTPASSFGLGALFRADAQNVLGSSVLQDDRYQPMDDLAGYDIASGSNPAVRDDTYTAGVLTASSGGTGSAFVFFKNAVPSVAGQKLIANPKTQTCWAVGSYTALALAPTSATTIWTANLTTNANDQISFRQVGGTSTTVFQMICDGTVSGSGLSQGACSSVATVGSGVTVGASNFYRWMIVWSSATATLTYLVNGVVAGTLVPGANMPVSAMSPAVLTTGLANVIKVAGLYWAWG